MKNPRVLVLFVFAALGFMLVLFRAVYLQIIPDDRLQGLKERQYETTITLRSRRGVIVDRTGKELAVSIRADSLFADPSLIEHPRKVSRQVAKILHLSVDEVYGKINDPKRRFVWLQRQLESDLVEKIKALKVRGLGFVEESKRVYPNGRLAASVLGFVGREGQGLAGVEARYDQMLRGEHKRISLPRDARGRPLLLSGHLLSENLDGADLELTVDHELQFVLEKELQLVTQKQQAAGAWGVVLDPSSGEILAMAQTPSFDPHNPQSATEHDRKNRLVSDVYEPGSVLKPLLVAQALETKKIQANSKFDCENGRMVIGDRVIREAEAKEKFGWLSVSEILAVSSNVGSVKIANQLGQGLLRDGLAAFGLGQKTNLDLQGESRGILHELPWRSHHFANISFGHGVSTTAIQVAMAYAAMANGGHLLKPYLVKSVRMPEGQTQHTTPQIVRRVISRETSDKMKMLLINSTAPGSTGVKARITGYPVAGKTGTAQKVDSEAGGYKKNAYISSFAGFVPAQDPRLVDYIAVDEPRKEYYGSSVAAPVFAKVASFGLRQRQVPPVLISETDVLPTGEQNVKQPPKKISAPTNGEDSLAIAEHHLLRDYGADAMPDLTGLTLREALRWLKTSEGKVKVVGEGVVVRSYPEASKILPKDRAVTLFLEP
jgi:cell division protein FtsI (penicillin-binding protein 3)